jgi:hypothetical protein
MGFAASQSPSTDFDPHLLTNCTTATPAEAHELVEDYPQDAGGLES